MTEPIKETVADIIADAEPVDTPMQFAVIWADEDIAQRLLVFNREPEAGKQSTNRKASKVRVDRYAADMVAGDWKENPQPISFSTDDEQTDGQQRLKALIQACRQVPGLRIPIVVAYNTPGAAKIVMDLNKPRTPGDILRMHGEVNTAVLASAAKLVYCVLNVPRVTKDSWGRIRWTPTILDHFLTEHPMLREGVTIAMKSRHVLIWSAGAALWYLAYKEIGDPYLPSQFMHGLAAGVDPDKTEDHALYRFREFLVRASYLKRDRTNDEYLAMAIKTFNAWALRETHDFRPGFRVDEKFPKLIKKDAIPALPIED